MDKMLQNPVDRGCNIPILSILFVLFLSDVNSRSAAGSPEVKPSATPFPDPTITPRLENSRLVGAPAARRCFETFVGAPAAWRVLPPRSSPSPGTNFDPQDSPGAPGQNSVQHSAFRMASSMIRSIACLKCKPAFSMAAAYPASGERQGLALISSTHGSPD